MILFEKKNGLISDKRKKINCNHTMKMKKKRLQKYDFQNNLIVKKQKLKKRTLFFCIEI